ncbi:hypothetical protein FA13DRAFT_807330 [Coprinellus micaceus]|uniref:Uncharacterized protein n=1 Tax=Coprinellus micaceus TaxID=71717 RepID=A0A4Y7S4Z7_COPMI|nr:hypothetical protein FA13DRAFT_807330 [Coprinellus micaceus]
MPPEYEMFGNCRNKRHINLPALAAFCFSPPSPDARTSAWPRLFFVAKPRCPIDVMPPRAAPRGGPRGGGRGGGNPRGGARGGARGGGAGAGRGGTTVGPTLVSSDRWR